MPLVRRAYACPTHTHNIINHLIIALDANTGKDQRAFLIYVACGRMIRRWNAVAYIRLVRLRADSKHMLVFGEDRYEECVVRRMRVAEVDVVMQECVAFSQIRMQATHCLGLQMRAKDVCG